MLGDLTDYQNVEKKIHSFENLPEREQCGRERGILELSTATVIGTVTLIPDFFADRLVHFFHYFRFSAQ